MRHVICYALNSLLDCIISLFVQNLVFDFIWLVDVEPWVCWYRSPNRLSV